MVVLNAGQLTTLRSHPHGLKFYLCCHVPRYMCYCQVNDAGIAKSARTITYDNSSWNTNPSGGNYTFADVRPGTTLYIGLAQGGGEIGRLRIRAMTATTITVAENDDIPWADDLWLMVADVHEPWSIFPRVLPNEGGTDVDIWQDYDIAYTSQDETCKPIPIMGPPAVGFLSGTPAALQVYFDGSQSYGLDGATIASYSWTFPGGSPASSAVATPGNVSWSTAGTYIVRLQVTDSNGKTADGYRMVRVYDSKDPLTGNAPYTEFEVTGLEGSWSGGGWRVSFTVRDRYGRLGTQYFRDNAELILFAEGVAGDGNTLPIPGNATYRSNMLFRGWVIGETIVKNPFTNEVNFEAEGICGRMSRMEQFSDTFEIPTSGAAAKWYQLENMTVDLAILTHLRWRSTILEITDVFQTGKTAKRIMRQDFTEGMLYDQCQKLMDAILGRMCGDKLSTIYMRIDPQVLPTGERGGLDTMFTLTDADWGRSQVELRRAITESVSQIDLAGVYHDGGTDPDVNAHPILALAPGTCPLYNGQYQKVDGLVLEGQAQANQVAGDILSWRNDEYPSIRMPMAGAWTCLDVSPPCWIQWTIATTWTKREISWTNARFIPRAVNIEIDNPGGVARVNLELEKEADGPDGITGIYPPTEATEPTGPQEYTPETNPTPPTPPAGGAGAWRKHVLTATSLGPYYTETFIELPGPGGTPTWLHKVGGMGADVDTLCLAFHPLNPEITHYCVTFNNVYRRQPGVSDDWVSILSATAAGAACGWPGSAAQRDPKFFTIQTNPGVPSDIYAVMWVGPGFGLGVNKPSAYFCKSTDMGASWSYHRILTSSLRYDGTTETPRITHLQVQSVDPFNDLYVGIQDSALGLGLYFSADRGATWTYRANSRDASSVTQYWQDPRDGTVFKNKVVGVEDKVFRSDDHGVTWTELGMKVYSNSPGKHWFNSQLVQLGFCRVNDGTLMYKSANWGATVETFLLGPPAPVVQFNTELVPDALEKLYLARKGAGSVGQPHVIWASNDEGVTLYPKGGANCTIPDTGGGDSIPYNAKMRDATPIWTLE